MFAKENMKKQKIIWDRLYEKGLTWKKISKLEHNLTNKLILELGVGNGKTLKSILNQSPKKVIAIDISKEAIKSIKMRIKILSLKIVDFLKLNTENKFDVIVCYYFLNNFNKKQRKEAVEKMKKLLNKNGVILFEDFAVGDFRQKGREIEENTVEKQNRIICHFFQKKEIEEMFKDFDIKINRLNKQ